MEIALIHDFLTQMGGAEKVLEELKEMFPKARVYTIVYDAEKTFKKYEKWDIKTSFIQKIPGGVKYYKWFFILMPLAVGLWSLKKYDLIISDSSAFSKGVRAGKIKHLCYCHTPTRYLWVDRDSYVEALPYPKILKLALKPVLAVFRNWDFKAASKVTRFMANSSEVKKRIKEYYNRDSTVVHPPVDTDFFNTPHNKPSKDYFLAFGRIEPYKRFDLVAEACQKMKIPLKIAGSGSAERELREKYGESVDFTGRVSRERTRELYQNAKALIFPQIEDAGITALEAMACGTPVIALRAGGVVDFVREGLDGTFFSDQNIESLSKKIIEFDHLKFDSKIIRTQALKFNRGVFRSNILSQVNLITNENRY